MNNLSPHQISPTMQHANFNRFSATFGQFGIDLKRIEDVWRDLTSKYSEKHRFYHTMDHIERMLSSLDMIRVETPALEHAIWFHDVIYDPKAGDNEAMSARYFSDLFGEFLSDQHVDTVHRLILATDPRSERNSDFDECLMRDIDLEILGAGAEDYEAYTIAIRREYSFVPEEDFRAGRSRILTRFLETPIYTTEFFKHLEDIARRNLKGEIERLKSS